MNRVDENYLLEFRKNSVYTCPKCQGRNSSCECWRGLELEIKKVKAGIPIRYRNFKLEDITHPNLTKIKDRLISYSDNIQEHRRNGVSLYLHGSSGLAKTASACSILIKALSVGYEARYFDSPKACIDGIMSDWGSNSKTTQSHISGYDFIAIDNMGTGVSGTAAQETLRRAIFERFNNMLPIIYISSFPKDELKDITEIHMVDKFNQNLYELNFKGFDYVKNVLSKAKKQDI